VDNSTRIRDTRGQTLAIGDGCGLSQSRVVAGPDVSAGRTAAARLLGGLALLLVLATAIVLLATSGDDAFLASDRLFVALTAAGLVLAFVAASFRVARRRVAARRTMAAALIVWIVPAAASVPVLGFFLAGLFAVAAADLLFRGRGTSWEDDARAMWAREEAETGERA
jgi:uncharacterized protein YqgC (DUF456 family)